MRRNLVAVAVVLSAVLLSACVAKMNEQIGMANVDGVVAGFWRGLWHGVIAPVTFILSLFTRDVQMFEVHNNGGWYSFGFLLGVTVFHGGGHAARPRIRGR